VSLSASFHPEISLGALASKTADPLSRVNGRLVHRMGKSTPKDVSLSYFTICLDTSHSNYRTGRCVH
jgi:hypothetical protein